MLLLRDYKYIDVAKVVDYLSSVDPGVVSDLTQRIRSNSGVDISGGINIQFFKMGGGARSADETELQQTVRVYAQHMFSRLHNELQTAGAIQTVDLDTPLDVDGLTKSDVLEITRKFRPSPLNQMLDSFVQVINMMQSMGLEDQLSDELGDEMDMRQVMDIVGWLRGEDESKEVPMFAKEHTPDGASVVFVAKENFLMESGGDFRGEMTVFGKVGELIRSGESLDLLDLLNVLPPGVREVGAFGGTFKELVNELMNDWPEEFGGPIERNEVIIEGPAVVITPVAAYNL